MAHETFPTKEPGDRLEADHVNELSEIARKFAARGAGNYLMGNPDIGVAASRPLRADVLIVTDGSSTNETDIKCRPQYWERDESLTEAEEAADRVGAGEWRLRKQTNESNEYFLDPEAHQVRFEKGDLVQAYWDDQRNGYIPFPYARDATVFPVFNRTGQNVRQFGVFGFEDITNEPVIDPQNDQEVREHERFLRQLTFEGDIPKEPDHIGKFCIFQGVPKRKENDFDQPTGRLEPGEIGWAVYSGVTIARVNVVNETDGFADIEDGRTDRLKSRTIPEAGSAQILWLGENEGKAGDTRWAVVRIPVGGGGAATEFWAQVSNKTEVAYTGDPQGINKYGSYFFQETQDCDPEVLKIGGRAGFAIELNLSNANIHLAQNLVRIYQYNCGDQGTKYFFDKGLTREGVGLRAII